jgi:hypothetical protein
MKPQVIRLVDLGLSDDFLKSMTFAQSLLASLNVGQERADVEYIHLGSLNIAARAMTIPARLIHVMAHGVSNEYGQAGFESDDDSLFFGLGDLARYLEVRGEGIEADGILADACGTAKERFLNSLPDCLERECTYIGTTRTIDWREATTFASILYGAMLSGTGHGKTGPDWVKVCADRSIAAYEIAVNGPCPYTTTQLQPSERARAAFKNSKRNQGLD